MANPNKPRVNPSHGRLGTGRLGNGKLGNGRMGGDRGPGRPIGFDALKEGEVWDLTPNGLSGEWRVSFRESGTPMVTQGDQRFRLLPFREYKVLGRGNTEGRRIDQSDSNPGQLTDGTNSVEVGQIETAQIEIGEPTEGT